MWMLRFDVDEEEVLLLLQAAGCALGEQLVDRTMGDPSALRERVDVCHCAVRQGGRWRPASSSYTRSISLDDYRLLNLLPW